ncbi:MAG: GntR family transcriptional regulator [Eubacteriales bacterium]|nr:GntR family transcriptional regulator [Eubacteriales bacterium]MDD4583165.1 GntR family transcriptional regulator [Eubacteriales bacterium]
MFLKTEGMNGTGLTLSGNLFSQLRKDILRGKLKAGEKLSEQQVCDAYGVSRTPVRETFRQLEQEGLIETIPNRGAFVVGLSSRDVQDLYEMRKAFEVIGVRWAIQRITKEELEKLKEAYEFMEFYTLKEDTEKMLNINMSFHELIYQAAHNRMLAHTLYVYQLYIKETKANSVYLDGKLEEVLNEHKKILDAFVRKDIEAGEEAITLHLENAKKRAKVCY